MTGNPLLYDLILCETDVDGALRRFCGDEALYISCVDAFLADPTMENLKEAIRQEEWDDAFTAAHALKGLAGNMGFAPLAYATGQLVITIRTGRIGEMTESLLRVEQCYRALCKVIRAGEKPA